MIKEKLVYCCCLGCDAGNCSGREEVNLLSSSRYKDKGWHETSNAAWNPWRQYIRASHCLDIFNSQMSEFVNLFYMSDLVPRAVAVNVLTFKDQTPCSPVEIHWRFVRNCHMRLFLLRYVLGLNFNKQCSSEAVGSSETTAKCYRKKTRQTTVWPGFLLHIYKSLNSS
jgi:hypothetical protein